MLWAWHVGTLSSGVPVIGMAKQTEFQIMVLDPRTLAKPL
jgi:hypothetical protein